ncbi:FecR domain-containing protein [Aureisphaera galaxeae]|uniref:FecR family protein n=1 Tax=Aureisphaera galaxeae TaxID=1538023 RepID=UPI002350285B|nr:FecR domain-containing protein [Aureisphaera galaxeae]MDC8003813.1 FecR domain-containing protein [Aureisphaera galaxeae]
MDKDYIIEKWLRDDLTPEERKAFEALDDFDLNTAIVENAKHFKASHFSEPADYETFKKRLPSKKSSGKVRFMTPFMRIAAMLVVGLGIYFLFFFNNLNTVSTLASEKTTIQLPDNSEVVLNALSSLSYSENRWDRKREVSLNGEAYFKVAKGKVFDVLTEDGTVTVVGTEFNVKQRDDYFEVKCYEGIVRVSAGETMKELTAGDSFRLLNGSPTFFETTYQLPQWTKNVSSFKAVPFSEVVEELERQYNVTVVISVPNFNPEFTGGFVHDNLENALKSITQPLELTYSIESNNTVRLEKSEQ